MKKISVLFLTFNRPDKALITLDLNLASAGIPRDEIELLICDQGTKDEHFIELLKQTNPDYIRLNVYNEGIARALNQLIIRATTNYFFFMPDDILLPKNWASELLRHVEAIPGSGIVGFEGQDLVLPEVECGGLTIRCNANPQDYLTDSVQVFGATLMTRNMIDVIGGYCEEYHPYGLEDSDLCFRCVLAGFLCYYIPNLKFNHIGVEQDLKREKESSFFSNVGLHRWRMFNYYRIGTRCPLPIKRDPLI